MNGDLFGPPSFFFLVNLGQSGTILKRVFILGGKNTKTMTRKQIIKIILSVLIAALTALGAAFGLSSCNVVRTITNRSEFFQRGDTSVTIQTKTIEAYDASRK